MGSFLSTPGPHHHPPQVSFLVMLLLPSGFAQRGLSRPPLSPQGTHESLKGNAKALSTVTAIIDGTGSIGLLLVWAPGS